MNHSRMLGIAALAAATGLALAGCSAGTPSSDPTGTGAVGETIVVGTSLPLTGPLEPTGPNMQRGYQQAVDEVNADGGLDLDGVKHPVELKVLDNGSVGDAAAQQAQELVLDDGAVALFSGPTPPISIPFSFAGEQLRVPTMIAITPVISWMMANPDGYQYSWAVFATEDDITNSQFLASDFVETNKKIAIFSDQEEDGKVFGDMWEAKAPGFGYEVVSRASFPVGTVNFTTQVAEAKQAGAEIVMGILTPPDAVALLNEMKAQNFVPQLTFLEKGGVVGGFTTITGGLGEGVLSFNVGTFGSDLPAYQALLAKWRDTLGGENAGITDLVNAYAVAEVLFDAMRRAGTSDPEAVNAEIANTNGEYAVGHIEFTPEHTMTIPVVQSQWHGNDQLLVLGPDGKARNPIEAPTPGLR